jgi:two-component system chemotaxis response regulator CheB
MSGLDAKAVVIGASAGAVEALSAILPRLPANYALPIMIVVHVPANKGSVLADLFRSRCALDVREAQDKEPIAAGHVYFAPADYHLLVEEDGVLSLSNEEPVHYSRPSIDVLFESAADAYGENLIAVVLTGASQDGAKGLAAVAETGGEAIVQDPRQAFSRAMPEAALAERPDARVLTLSEIADYLRGVGQS